MGFRRYASRRLVLGSVLLAAAVGAGFGLPNSAFAVYTVCRTDPTVTLSNGVAVTMWATMDTDVSQVQSVNYVLHVPKGVTVGTIAYDKYGYLEHVQVVADQSGTHYEDQTTTFLTSGSATMTAYATRRDQTVASKNGTTGATITLNWCT